MRLFFCSLLLTFFWAPAVGQNAQPAFVTVDIDHFWAAYDQIISTRDSLRQYEYLQRLFLDKGTPGLRALMDARGYKIGRAHV